MNKLITLIAIIMFDTSIVTAQLEKLKDNLQPLNAGMLAFVKKNVDMENKWIELHGSMGQVAAHSGHVWALGTILKGRRNMEPLNYEVFYLTGNQTWQYMEIHAKKVTVDGRGNPWVINARHEIYKGVFSSERNGNKASVTWHRIPGYARDIDACWDGVYIITTNKVPGTNNYTVAFWNGTTWLEQLGNGGVKIAADHKFQPWVINSDGGVYQRKSDNTWIQHINKASVIDIDTKGNVFIANTMEGMKSYGYPVSILNTESQDPFWQNLGGEVISIAADDKRIVVVNNANQVFTRYYKSNRGSFENEQTIERQFLYNLCPQGSGGLDFNGAPKIFLRTGWEISKDSSRVFMKLFALIYFGSDWTKVSAKGEWLIAVGEPAPYGSKYTKAEFLNNSSPTTEMTIQLHNTGFNEVINGCDGREEAIDASTQTTFRDPQGRIGSVIDEIRVIGDTGGNDVSTDDNCNCDARIISIRLKPFKLKTANR